MFRLKLSSFIALLFSVLLLAGCSRYQRLVKSTDMEKKYEAAVKYYEDGDHFRALTLFEELISVYRATKRAEKIYFYYAYCYFHQKEYDLASFHFENFVNTFPNSSDAEECQFMIAYCYYMNSPTPTLDQDNTLKAINNLQLFINKYPKSAKVAQSNDLIDLLREKLQTKDYNTARLYYNMGDYKSAVVAFRNLVKDYPATRYREESMFLMAKSYYLLANNSIEAKKEERYKFAVQSYYSFIDAFPQSRYLKEAQDIFNSSLAQLEKIKNVN
jgi:outer membrane protein assembly factor BamD